MYSKAIEKNPNSAVYFANRSISNLRLENFGYALTDASMAIDRDRSYTKAYYRRAAAYMSLGKYKLALKDFEYVSTFRLSLLTCKVSAQVLLSSSCDVNHTATGRFTNHLDRYYADAKALVLLLKYST